MKTGLWLRMLSVGLMVSLAVPLTASARHHRSRDVAVGALVGVFAGAMLASAERSTVYVATPPPPPPPPVYGYSYGYVVAPPPPPPPAYGYGCYGAPRYPAPVRHSPPPRRHPRYR